MNPFNHLTSKAREFFWGMMHLYGGIFTQVPVWNRFWQDYETICTLMISLEFSHTSKCKLMLFSSICTHCKDRTGFLMGYIQPMKDSMTILMKSLSAGVSGVLQESNSCQKLFQTPTSVKRLVCSHVVSQKNSRSSLNRWLKGFSYPVTDGWEISCPS